MSPLSAPAPPEPTRDALSLRALGRHTVVYGLGGVLFRLVSFIMLPVYTRLLTPADYGVLQLLQMTLDVAAILLSAGTTAGVFRFYFKEPEGRDRHTVMTTALALLAALNAVGAVVLFGLAPWIWSVVLKGAGTPELIRIAAGNFLLEALFTVPFLYMQAEHRAVLFIGASLVKLLMQLGLNILFLVVFRLGVEGVLLSTLVTSIVVGSAVTAWMLSRTGFRISRRMLTELRRFGMPYQFVTAGTFILTFGDRYFLQASHGVAVVGLYGLAYQFGFLLSGLGATAYFRAWNPQRFRLALEPKPLRDERYNQGFLYLNLVVISLAVGICLLIGPVLAVMSAPAFRQAADFVPFIVAAYVMQAWTDMAQLGIDVSEKTKFATVATWISVAVILALYAWLIPPYGGMGAAVATFLAFALRFALFYYFAQRLWPVGYEWGPHLRLVAAALAAVLLSELLRVQGIVPQLVRATLLFAAYAAVTWFLVLGSEERSRIGRALGELRRITWRGVVPRRS
jgi:O-antigen/teichoic acid export membrane protein